MNTAEKTLSQDTKLAMDIIKAPRIEKLFKSRSASIKYIFTNGHVANFIRGRYFTADEGKIAELMALVNDNHPEIYVDPNETESDPRLDDPKIRMRAEVIKELFVAEQHAIDPDRDMGTTAAGSGINSASTRTIAATAAGGSGESLKAQLAKLAGG